MKNSENMLKSGENVIGHILCQRSATGVKLQCAQLEVLSFYRSRLEIDPRMGLVRSWFYSSGNSKDRRGVLVRFLVPLASAHSHTHPPLPKS